MMKVFVTLATLGVVWGLLVFGLKIEGQGVWGAGLMAVFPAYLVFVLWPSRRKVIEQPPPPPTKSEPAEPHKEKVAVGKPLL